MVNLDTNKQKIYKKEVLVTSFFCLSLGYVHLKNELSPFRVLYKKTIDRIEKNLILPTKRGGVTMKKWTLFLNDYKQRLIDDDKIKYVIVEAHSKEEAEKIFERELGMVAGNKTSEFFERHTRSELKNVLKDYNILSDEEHFLDRDDIIVLGS